MDWHSFTGPVFDVLPRYRHFRVLFWALFYNKFLSPQFELKSASALTHPPNEEGSPMHLVTNLVTNLSPNSVIRHVIF